VNRIRLATAEEVESIKAVGDTEGAMVLALTTEHGVPLAVVRTVVEVDPVVYPPDLHNRLKLMFQRDIETVLAAKGVAKYYFNVHASNTNMLEVGIKNLGAVQVSTEPEFRFVKAL
jgi:hypothetical protein